MLSFGPPRLYRLGASAVAILLSACSQPADNANAVLPAAQLSPSARSTLQIDASKLLYVSDAGTNEVQVYAFPKPASPIQTLTGFSEPQGLCSGNGNAFVTNTGDSNILEYAAGTSSPSQTLRDANAYPVACSYDAKSGNLSVLNISPNAVVIYQGATGNPIPISSQKISDVSSIQYDGSGNLFLLGLDQARATVLGEIPYGKKSVKIACSSLGSEPLNQGGLAWDGQYLTVSGQTSQALERIKGCKVVGTTPFASSDIVQYAISGNRLVGADAGNASVEIYAYPKGGKPIQQLGGLSEPIGTTIVNVKGK